MNSFDVSFATVDTAATLPRQDGLESFSIQDLNRIFRIDYSGPWPVLYLPELPKSGDLADAFLMLLAGYLTYDTLTDPALGDWLPLLATIKEALRRSGPRPKRIHSSRLLSRLSDLVRVDDSLLSLKPAGEQAAAKLFHEY